MKRKFLKTALITVITLTVMALSLVGSSAADTQGQWIAAWGTGITEANIFDIVSFGTSNSIIGAFKNLTMEMFKDITFRTVITPSASGSKIRLKLSNIYGKKDFVINRLTVAKSVDGSTIDKNSVKALLSGTETIVIPAGKEIYTEEIDFDVKAMEPIAVSMYVKEENVLCNIGMSGGKTYISLGDNATKSETMKTDLDGIAELDLSLSYDRISLVPVLSSVDVYCEEKDACSVVVIGDSTVANDFTYYLAKQINDMGYTNVGVVNKGVMGNCLLTDASATKMFGKSLISRMEQDALDQAGVKYVVCKIGANDIINPMTEENQKVGMKQPTYEELKKGYQKLNQMCLDEDVKLIYMSITPWKGYDRDFTGTNSLYSWNANDWNIAVSCNKYFAATSNAEYYNINKISSNSADSKMLDDAYTEDYFHPNKSLQLIWAQNFPLAKIGVVVKPTKVKLNTTAASVNTGKTVALTAKVLPTDAVDKTVSWSSSDTKIATVTQDGVVKGIAPGTVTIICTTNTGNIKSKCTVKVIRKVTGVELNKSAITIYQTQTQTLTATVFPSDATNKAVKWSSDDAGVATVTSSGKIKGITPGTCIVTVKTSDGLYKESCKVTVKKRIPVTKVNLNTKNKTIVKGKTYTLVGSVYPENASIKTFSWTTSNKKVATVSADGVVTAVSGGTARITCMSDDSGVYAICTISVKSPVSGVKLNKKTAEVYINKTCQLVATVTPSDATSVSVTWFSDDTDIATVDHDGLVKGVKKGKTTVYCMTDEGDFIASCAVTVKKFVKVSDIDLEVSAKTIYVSNKYQLKPVFFPENASNQSVKWTTSDKKIATVSSSGVVTGKSVGSCTITCTSVDGNKKALCKIKVNGYPASAVTLTKSSIVINDGKSERLTAKVMPENAADKSVTWATSNKNIAVVSSTGKVTGINPGKCTVTCTTVSGNYKAKCTVTVLKVGVTGVAISTDSKTAIKSATVNVASKLNLKAIITPSNASDKSVKWMSSDNLVAAVSSNGVVTGISKGSAYIYCTSVDSGANAMILVYVKTPAKVTGVNLNKTSVVLAKGKTTTITATVLPTNAGNQKVTWSSSNTKVATVSTAGKVTAKGEGTCTITVKTADGGKTAKCTVVVPGTSGKVQHVIGVKLSRTSMTLNVKEYKKLTATVLPTDATNKNVKWTSSNPKVAQVYSNGLVIGISSGTAVITAISEDNSIKATCTVTVK